MKTDKFMCLLEAEGFYPSSVEAVKITFLLNLWWSAFMACP